MTMETRLPLKNLMIFLLLFPLWAGALPPGATIRGTVTDVSGASRHEARIVLLNEETNETRGVQSLVDGTYALSVIPPGSYRLEVRQQGFRTFVKESIVLRVGEELLMDIEMMPGEPSDVVVVTAPQSMVQRDSASVGLVIENAQIDGLPLDGRNFLELGLLVPGTAPSAQGSPGSIRGKFTVNVNGAREDANNFLLDGVYNGDPTLNTSSINPPVDGIREFRILTSSYDASYGRSGGAQVNVALKSGTNIIHGTAYEFFRNSAMDARNYFALSKEQYQRNQFGFSLGGPVLGDRTFFFVDYEGRRVREGITLEATVPSQLERTGDFSRSAKLPINPFTQQPFPEGQIPEYMQSDIGRAIVGLYPLPNRTPAPGRSSNFVSSPVLRDRDDRFDVRLDHSLTDSSTITFRYSFADRDLYEPFSGPTFARVPGFGSDIPRRAQNVMLGYNHTFSSALINELRFGFNRVALGVLHENIGTSVNRSVGLPELSSNPRDFGLSFISASGLSPIGDESNNPQHGVTNSYQVLDNVTFMKGRHLLKFGFEFRALQQNAFRDVQSRGFITFSDFGRVSGNALADLLLGFPSLTGGALLDNHQHLRTKSFGVFFQDSYRVLRNLNLTLGLRYEYNTPPVDRFDRANVYDSATRSLVRVGTNGVPRGAFGPDRNNWAPRVGIAWSPGSAEGTVLHAGYGVYYDQSPLAPSEGLYFNYPYFNFNMFFSLPGMPLTLDDPFPSSFPLELPNSALGFQRDLRSAYLQHWNFKVEQQIGRNRVLDVAYVGSKGTRLLSARDINQPGADPQIPNPRPDPRFDDILYLESRSGSTYHSLQTRFQQRFNSGVDVLGSYTLGKSLDDASTFYPSSGDPNFPQNSSNVGAEKARSNFDVRHRFSCSSAMGLPIGVGRAYLSNLGWVSSVLSGWKAMAILTLQTGRPLTVALLPEIDRSNTGRAGLGFGANDRPNRLAGGRVGDPTPEAWFDPAAFSFPEFGSFGDSGRNILDGPGYADFSFSLLKDTKVTERVDVQFRAEFFNLFNRANFNLPDNFLGSPTFGQILSAQSPRRVQFGLKLIF